MSEIDNGGSAFPYMETDQCPGYPSGLISTQVAGMSLRDYFMAHCPITFADAERYNKDEQDLMAFFIGMRRHYADAMLIASEL